MNLFFATVDHFYSTPKTELFRYYSTANYSTYLRFTFNHQSKMWSQSDPDLLDLIATSNSVYYNHNSSLSVENFLANTYIRTNFDITA